MRSVGIGYRNLEDPHANGREAALEALGEGGFSEVALALAFCTGATDPQAFFAGVRSVVGEGVPILGGAAVGIITAQKLGYRGFPGGVALFDAEVFSVQAAWEGNLQGDPVGTGRRLGDRLFVDGGQGLALLFFDTLAAPASQAGPPRVNSSRPLLQGLYECFPVLCPLFGAGLVGDSAMTSAFVFNGEGQGRDRAAAAVLTGGFRVHGAITHGSSPLEEGTTYRITRQEGAVIHDLDGRPIVDILNELYGDESWQQEVPVRSLALGAFPGWSRPFEYEACVNRLIMGPLPDRSGVLLFEEGPQVGDEVRFLRRDPERMLDSARTRPQELLERIAARGERPLFAFYIDCAGRTARSALTSVEEASFIQKAMAEADVPLLGFYSGIEIAPLQGQARSLDWTGVLMVITESGTLTWPGTPSWP